MKQREKDRFTEKIFFRLWIPAMISSLGLAFGDMADAVVVGQRMGATGLAAISLSLPVYMVMNVFLHSLGLGGSSRYSRLLGEGRKEEAIACFNRILQTGLLLGLLLSAAGSCFLEPLLQLLGTGPEDGELFWATREYVRIIVWGIPLFFAAYILNYFLRNDNQQKLAAAGFTTANLCDIGMNILFVLVWDMGAAGAALSTVLGQLIAICCYLPGLARGRGFLRPALCPPDFGEIWECFHNGFSVGVQYICQLLFLLLVNRVLLASQGAAGVAVFDLIQNVSYLILYLYDGTAKAMQPLISTYCGEQNEPGRKRTMRLGFSWGALAGGAVILLMLLFPQLFCRFFGLVEPSVQAIAVWALRIYGFGAFFAGLSVLLEGGLQAQGADRDAFLLTVLRGTAVLLPCTLVFSLLPIRWFWFLFPATELLSLVIFLVWRARFGTRFASDRNRVFTRTILNRNEDLGALLKATEDFCERWQADARQTYFVIMAVEEVCLAIMQKGFSQDGVGYIQVTLISRAEGEFELHIRDTAKRFNPFSLDTGKAGDQEAFDPDNLGMLVIREKAKSFFYRQYQGFNTLIIRI